MINYTVATPILTKHVKVSNLGKERNEIVSHQKKNLTRGKDNLKVTGLEDVIKRYIY